MKRTDSLKLIKDQKCVMIEFLFESDLKLDSSWNVVFFK